MSISPNASNLLAKHKRAATAAFLLVLLVAVLPFFFSGGVSDVSPSQTIVATSDQTIVLDGGDGIHSLPDSTNSIQSSSVVSVGGPELYSSTSLHSSTVAVQTQLTLIVFGNPVALGDTATFKMVVSPLPPTPNDCFSNLTLLVYRPDGTVDLLGPFQSDVNASKTVSYKPEMIGSYTVQATYSGQFFTSRSVTYLGGESPIATLSVLSEGFPVTPKAPRTWIVDDDGVADFRTIQEAINAASRGDTVFVLSGTYRENVVVNKSLSIIGESASRVAITPQFAGKVVTITASSVTFEEFRIQGSGNLHENDHIGIYFANPNASSSIVRGNIISANGYGISLSGSQNTIDDNSFANNHLGGILVNHSSNNLIMRNKVTGNDSMFGIFISYFSYNNILRNNNMTGSDLNLHIFSYDLQGMIHDVDSSNTVNGKPVYYWINKSNQAVPHDAGAVYLINCSAITAQELEIEQNGAGVYLGYSKGCIVQKNHITGCSNAIRLESSSSNVIRNNDINEPEDCGIAIVRSSTNTVCNNTIRSSSEADGLFVFTSSENHFYHNILSCKHQVWTENYTDSYTSRNNTWDDGYPAGGNYWSDYNGTDANHDGIGDSPYIIDADDRDRYPLIYPPSGDTTSKDSGQRTWTADDDLPADFHTIQEAINAASNGDTIFVHSGTYVENLVISKPLTLIGENASQTILVARNPGKAVLVGASRVTIAGFTIQGSGTQSTNIGIYFSTSTSLGNVSSNILTYHGYAISLSGSRHTVDSNFVTNNGVSGIYLNGTSNNLITRNNVTGNAMTGIYIAWPSTRNVLRNNTMTESELNLHVISYDLAGFTNDIDTSNTVNSKPIYYWVSKTNQTVPSDAGVVVLVNCTNITVQNLKLERSGQGVLLAYTNDSVVQLNSIVSCGNGIRVQFSSNNTLEQNDIYMCASGVALMNASSNTIRNNTVTASSNNGLFVFLSPENQFYHNNLNNKVQVWTDDLAVWNNTWDNDYPAGGNYWSNYDGTDANGDGVGDTPYVIDVDNVDHYPLVAPTHPS